MPHHCTYTSNPSLSAKAWSNLIFCDLAYALLEHKSGLVESAFKVKGDADKEFIRLNAVMKSCGDKRRYDLFDLKAIGVIEFG